jgi:hypothetical protein
MLRNSRVFIVRAHHAVGAEQRLAFDFDADHRELTVQEAECLIARGGEAELTIGPVLDREDFFPELRCHLKET